jgi:hypothetical protein
MGHKKSKFRIVFENGETKTIVPIRANMRVLKKTFKEHTGISYNFNEEYFFTQIENALLNWLDTHGLYHPAATELIHTAAVIIATEQQRQNGGFIAFVEEDFECLLVILPRNYQDYVWRISKMLDRTISGKEADNEKLITCITVLEDEIIKPTINSLEKELSIAVDTENYELAAKLRDKIAKYKKEVR